MHYELWHCIVQLSLGTKTRKVHQLNHDWHVPYHILRNFLGPQKVGPWTYLVYCVIYSHYHDIDLRTLSRQNMNQIEYYMYITIIYIYIQNIEFVYGINMVTIDRRTGWHQPSHLPRIRSQWRWQWRDTLPSKTSGVHQHWQLTHRGISQSDTKIRSTQKTMGNLHAIHGYSWVNPLIHYFDWAMFNSKLLTRGYTNIRNQLWWFHQDENISTWSTLPAAGSLRSIHHIMNMAHGIEDGVLLSRKGLWYNML